MSDDVGTAQRLFELELRVQRAFYNMAESLGLVADVLADLAMDARTRIETAQEIQDRVGVVFDAIGISSGRGRADVPFGDPSPGKES